MSDAAVGSISHILKTAFKDVYNEPQKRQDAAERRLAKEQALAEAAAVVVEGGGGEVAAEEEAAVTEQPSPAVEEYLAPLERLAVASSLTSYMGAEHAKIDSELSHLNQDAAELTAYLRKQRDEAYAQEEAEEEALKKQGVMLGQHIPSLPSKLSLDPAEMGRFGNYSNNLVIARELIADNKTNTLRRTGNLPISDLAEQKKMERTKKAASASANVPHYQYQTGAADVRKERIQLRFAAITRARQLEEEDRATKLAASGLAPAPRKHFAKSRGLLTGAQRMANEEILRGMNHKLHYLRNPRNIPQAINRLITRNEGSILGPEHVQEEPSVVSSHGHVSSEADSKRSKFAQPPKVTVPLFAADPPALTFSEYDVGREYTLPVSFRNVSAVSRMVRVLPPSTPYFSLSALQYPRNSKAGLCAAGMSVTATLSFFPHSLGDYEDALQVETEGGAFTVPIVAQREAPRLSLPSVLDLGVCLVGDAMRVSVNCSNAGGSGSFRLVRAEDYPDLPEGMDWETMGCARMPPFTVYPVEFTLHRGEAVDVNVEFVPLRVGPVEQDFLLLCDNTQVLRYTLRAAARVLALSVIEVNGAAFDATDASMRRDLFFEAANIGIEQTQQIVVANDTGLAVEYEWVLVDAQTRDKDLHKAGQNRIREREHQQRKRNALESGDGLRGPGRKPNTAVRNGFEQNVDSKPSSPARAPTSPGSSRPGTSGLSPMHTLLESLEDEPRNRVVEKEFEISPARGLMPLDGAEPFVFSFTPTGLGLATQRAVLMLRSVPMAALPGPAQGSLLSQLQHRGHGAHVRLLSWLDEMGSPAHVEKYSRANGQSSTVAQLNSLQSVFGLVMGHANGLVDAEEIRHVEVVVRCVLRHVESWINDEMEEDESLVERGDGDGEEEEGGGEGGGIVRLGMYRWTGDAHREPQVIPPLNIARALSRLAPLDQASRPETGDGPSVEEKGGAMDSPDGPASLEGPPPSRAPSRGVSFAPADEFNNMPPLPALTAEERALLCDVFIDAATAVVIIGPVIGDVLDDKVKHEAVDYLRDATRLHVAGLSLSASGEGKPQEIHLSPPLLQVCGQLAVGSEWTGQFSLSNPSSAMAEIEMCSELLQVFGVPAPGPRGGVAPAVLPPAAPRRRSSRDGFTFDVEDDGDDEAPKAALAQGNHLMVAPLDPSLFVVEFSPARVLLLPESESTVDVSVTAFACGQYRLVVPCRATMSDARVDSLTIAFTSTGPRLRFLAPEVDLGLIGVRSSSDTTFSFCNDSDVPACFSFAPLVEPDPEQQRMEMELGLATSTPQAGGRATPLSSAAALGASESELLEPNAAAVTVSPPSGQLGPGETVVCVLSCRAGKIPQRLRGRLECRVFDASGSCEQRTQVQAFRGEIQAPKTIVYPMSVDLGVVFVGMPVTFQVTTENICNLPTTYKLSRPGGDSALFSLTFDKPEGPLGAKERVVITATFVATMPGKIDDVMANKIFGVLSPLGFVLKAVARPLQVDFPLLPEGQAPPAPLAPPSMTQFHNAAAPPEPLPIKPLDFTAQVPLYERRTMRFAIRNLSAIPASFELKVRKFAVMESVTSEALEEAKAAPAPAPGTKSRAGTAASRKTTAPADPDTQPLLRAHENGAHKFHSADGQKYAGAAVERQTNRLFLTSGLGASYLVEPPTGLLAPWAVVVVTVRTFNDMPAAYDDELEVSLMDVNRTSRRSVIPLKMSVLGCPMVIEGGSLGMTTVPRDKSMPLEVWQRSAPQQLLQLGVSPVFADPSRRVFFVRNNGSMPGKVSWKIRAVTGKINGPIKLELATSAEGRVKSNLLFWSDVAKEVAFHVEPESATIRPYASQAFTVTLFRTDSLGREDAQLIGDVFFEPGATTGLALNPSGASLETSNLGSVSHMSVEAPSLASTLLPAASTRDKSYRLLLQLQGSLIAPCVTIDKRVLQAGVSGLTQLSDRLGIKFKTDAVSLFGRRAANERRGCSKAIPIVNPTDATLVCAVSTQGPFTVSLQGDDSRVGATKASSSSAASLMSQSLPSGSKMKTLVGSEALGRTVTLLPGASASFSLAFNPPRALREALQRPQKPEAGPVPDETGQLLLSFSTGQRLALPLSAQIAAPFLAGSSAKLYFGTVGVGMQSDGVLLLSNPTAVQARWTVAAVPGAAAKVSAIRVPGFQVPEEEIDDPGAFVITPSAGEVAGPTVSVVAATSALPKDLNRREDLTPVVAQRLSETSWSTQTLSFRDTVQQRHQHQHQSASDACYPQPVRIVFAPAGQGRYGSRFRFTCEFGNSFDVLLQGHGTFEEHLHAPLYPEPG